MTRIIICFVLSGLTLTGQSLDLFDQYGGAKNLPCPTGATAHWYVEKISNRWWFCTPDGNAFWLHSVWNVNSSSSTSRAGVRLGGSLNSAAPRMAVQARRIRTWGFNALDAYSSRYASVTLNGNMSTTAGASNPAVPVIIGEDALRPSADGLNNTNNLISVP